MWHPHSESWGQWPMQQSAYANVPAEQVDWGALAQQWIAHKEHAVHLPVGHGVGEVGAHGHGPPYAPWGWNSAPTAPHSADWNNSSGLSTSWHPSGPAASANPDVPVPPPVPQYVDYGHGNYEVQSFDYNHGGVTSTLPASTSWDYQSSSGSATSHSVWPPEPASQPPPPPPPEESVETASPSLILMPDSTVESSVAVDASENASHRTHQHHHHHHRRQSQHVVPHVPVNDADDSGTISDAKRKILPSWIREGLEKMEREKMKKLEREKQEKEREEKEKLRVAAEKAAAEAQHSEQSGEPTLPRKSRFDMDGDTTRQEKPALPVTEGLAHHSSESVQTHAVSSAAASKPVISSSNVSSYRDTVPVTTAASGTAVAAAQPEAAAEMSTESSSEEDDQQSLSAEERQRRLIEKVKEMLTTVLKDVTDEQIRIIAKETYVKCRQRASKAPAKQLAKSSALASLTMFGAGDDSDNSDSGGERKRKSAGDSSDSDEEDVEYRLRKKKAEFHKAQRERLLRLEREEQLARDSSESVAVKEEQSSEKKADGSRGRDDTKVPDDNNPSLQQGSRQSPARGHSAASSSDKIGHADVRSDQHENDTSSDGTVQHKYDRHKGEKSSELTGKSVHGDATYGRRGSDDLDKKTARRAASQLSSPDRVRSEPSKIHGSSASVREERCRVSKSPVTKGGKQGANDGSPETAESNFRSSVPSQDKEAKKHADGSTASKKVSVRERDSTADSDASSNSDSDSSTSSSSRSGDDRQQSVKKRTNVEEHDRSPGRRRERERRRERSTSGVKRSSDTMRDSRKSRDRDKRRSHKKHSRRSSSRDSSDRFSGRRRRDKKDDYRMSSRSPSRKSRRSRSPAVVRKSSSAKHRDRSEDRSSKRRRRDASTSESEERGGKKASHKTSRTRRRSRS